MYPDNGKNHKLINDHHFVTHVCLMLFTFMHAFIITCGRYWSVVQHIGMEKLSKVLEALCLLFIDIELQFIPTRCEGRSRCMLDVLV
jgi:hypothetical protein